ncbi:hypothetical protein M427DRAFT_59906 [Gonapodya prolifera JEL478]|uniref:26S proteasome complex subunit SEM1 n=1 Tax=Gonapodya prolifera (strain JEL478) TaxID=1344416 RepID=A0A139A6S5_GONPJ|nr:hypothetical protein M427DRAFT_59906 [Gonapodya prolifera JEL478]|eukprot:KXS12043.1 hypothetical protein M427DRAFT_59906 [Gonapodya prolifera JEL478]
MATDPALPRLGATEEDDEFEEFQTEDWPDAEEDPQEAHMWEDSWDNDDLDDEFTVQLRAELIKADEAKRQAAEEEEQSKQQGQEQQPGGQ